MSESEQEFELPEGPQIVASAGRTLALARENAGLSVEEAASKLHLSARQILALESDEIAALPGSTFIRGFIRNYARLVGIDPQPLLEAYQVSAPDAAKHSISLNYENIPIHHHDKKVWLPYLLASLVVGAALGGWMLYMEYGHQFVHSTPVTPPPTEAAVTPQAPAVESVTPESVAATLAQDAPPPAEVPAELPVTSQPVANQPVTAPAQPTAPVPVAASIASAAGKVAMSLSEQSWVSVTDRDGKEIFNKTLLAGSQDAVDGTPPLKIVIGNATGVKLSYNGKSVDLAPYAKANVARLTLE